MLQKTENSAFSQLESLQLNQVNPNKAGVQGLKQQSQVQRGCKTGEAQRV